MEKEREIANRILKKHEYTGVGLIKQSNEKLERRKGLEREKGTERKKERRGG